MLESIRRFQEALIELGVARSVIARAAPRTLAIEEGTSSDRGHTTLFAQSVQEPEISSVSRDLYASGHYNLAVSEAFKALDKYVCCKAGIDGSGTAAMRKAFNDKIPILSWSNRATQSEKDEHEGYSHLYAGSMLGIRNPTIHEFNWIDNPDEALELIVIAQHLLRKAKASKKSQ